MILFSESGKLGLNPIFVPHLSDNGVMEYKGIGKLMNLYIPPFFHKVDEVCFA